jgi:hypothetical protein
MEVNPQTLFEMTGIFDKDRAMQRFNKAAGIFLIALQAGGGSVAEGPGLGIVWAAPLQLPPRGFVLLLNVMRKLGWIERSMGGDKKFNLVLTAKGDIKAVNYKNLFDAALEEKEAGDDA